MIDIFNRQNGSNNKQKAKEKQTQMTNEQQVYL